MTPRGSRSAATFIYRGQLDVELSRIRFLLEAVAASFDTVDAVLLSPGAGATEDGWRTFAKTFHNVRSCSFIAAERGHVVGVRRRLKKLIAADAGTVVAVGFSAAAHLPVRSCLAWCVNGIPEERLLHGDTPWSRLAVRLAWRAARRCCPSMTVVVSEPMGRLVSQRLGGRPVIVPNAVDRSVFHSDPASPPRYLTYEGGASPWQGLDQLSSVWSALHELAPSLRFRVISQDARAKVLTRGIAPEAVDVVATSDHRIVARHLREARLGFLVRAPHLVNEVAWPMKLGEYLAAGAPVVVSRCGWDAERVIARHGAGLVIDWSDEPKRSAAKIARYLDQIGNERPLGVEAAADELDAAGWHAALVTELRQAVARSAGEGGR